MDIEIDITNTSIETSRLLLRPWQETDLKDFYDYVSVDGVGEMAGWKHHTSIEESQKILRQFITDKNIFALMLKSNRKVIGSLGFHYSWANDDPRYADKKVKELGYVLSKEYWGNGLMPEAVKSVIRYCFYDSDLDALTVGHFPQNSQSKRVIEKCGFKYVKQTEFDAVTLGKVIVQDSYILLKENMCKNRSFA